MTEFLPRSAWTSTAPGGATLTGSKLQGVACHYPASGDIIMANLTREQVASRLRGWRDYHVNVRGWSDIGYQVAVDGAGRVWDLRGITRVPAAHASPSNEDANEEFGACLWVVGDNEKPTAAAIQAFRDWRTNRWLTRWPGRTNVRGHRQVPGAQTSCPGDQIINLIASGALTQGATPPPEDWFDMATKAELAEVIDARLIAHADSGTALNGMVHRQALNALGTASASNGLSALHALIKDKAAEAVAERTGTAVHETLIGRSGISVGIALERTLGLAAANAEQTALVRDLMTAVQGLNTSLANLSAKVDALQEAHEEPEPPLA